MGADKFKFISPGIFIEEIDESGIPALPERMGPLIIGRFSRGPGNRPVRVNSYKEFVSMFGAPQPGNASGDIWRSGDMTAPTYAAYAAQAWLRNNSPCTVYRVLGEQASNADSGATPQAGWQTEKEHNKGTGRQTITGGGAFGLFVFPSASFGTAVQGTLAAIWYVGNDSTPGAVSLVGTRRGLGDGPQGVAGEGAGLLIEGNAGPEFTVKILGSSTTDVKKQATFNFDRDSDLFIRKVFNTDPTKVNSDIVPATEDTLNYWLGETFESNVRAAENSKLQQAGAEVANTLKPHGVILALEGANSGITWGNRLKQATAAQTGWFISQDTRGSTYADFTPESHTEKLFKLHALDSGESANRDIKISITTIKAPTDNYNKFGTFTVEVRSAYDTDAKPQILEQYSGCNLDPTSPNYIGRKIGDMHYTYDSTNKTIVEHGDNPIRSEYVRVEVTDAIANGGGEGLLPFGVYGPLVPITHNLNSGSGLVINENSPIALGSGSATSLPWATLDEKHFGTTIVCGLGDSGLTDSSGLFSGSIAWPTTRLRVSSSEGNLVLGTRAYFGYASTIKDSKRFDAANLDLLRGSPAEFDSHGSPAALTSSYSWVFTLDDVRLSAADSDHAVYLSGSRAGGASFTVTGEDGSGTDGTYKSVLDKGYDKFTSPMFGGFDGFDVTEQDPFRNSYMSSGTEKSNSSFYSLKKAIDVTSDKDFLEYDVAVLPGITNTSLNTSLIDACEDRGDALAIVDLSGGYKPPHERATSETSTHALGSVTTVVNNLKDMGLNSSYGCAFYPWVKVRDNANDALLYVPPSVVALGTMSSAQRKSAVWFAPAGFTRGGLSEGSAGLPVVGVRQRLTASDRDKLYDANINPIASFPAEGIVIFGQKTLQVTPSALDRINVRRLLIFLKKEISRIASTVLFDQNVQATWDRFTGQVVPFLEGVQAGLGLTDFKVILDDSTTTPDLVDRNILYAKIFLKPARAIEFIALDFIITRSGASFDD